MFYVVFHGLTLSP